MNSVRWVLVLPLGLMLGACAGEPAAHPEAAWPPGCEPLPADAPELRTGLAGKGAPTSTGPGDDFPAHSRGPLDYRERVYVIGECGEWLQARTIPEALLRRERARLGEGNADEQILFWVRSDHVR